MHALGIGLSGEGKSRKGEQPPNPNSSRKNGRQKWCIYGTAPRCLSGLICCTALLTSHQDAVSGRRPPGLVIPLSRLVTVGDWSFAVAGPRLWNTLHAWGHYICAVSTGVSTKTEDAFVSAILSGHYIVACLACCARWSLKLLLRPP